MLLTLQMKLTKDFQGQCCDNDIERLTVSPLMETTVKFKHKLLGDFSI